MIQSDDPLKMIDPPWLHIAFTISEGSKLCPFLARDSEYILKAVVSEGVIWWTCPSDGADG
jgi:hypothetical protein